MSARLCREDDRERVWDIDEVRECERKGGRNEVLLSMRWGVGSSSPSARVWRGDVELARDALLSGRSAGDGWEGVRVEDVESRDEPTELTELLGDGKRLYEILWCGGAELLLSLSLSISSRSIMGKDGLVGSDPLLFSLPFSVCLTPAPTQFS